MQFRLEAGHARLLSYQTARALMWPVRLAAMLPLSRPRHEKLFNKLQLAQGELPMGTAMGADGKKLFVSTGRGNTVAVIDTADNSLGGSIPVGGRAWGH